MDFRGITVMKFAIEAGRLNLTQLPASWAVPDASNAGVSPLRSI